MKQLSYLEDSLTTKYEDRKVDFKSYLDNNLYLRNTNRVIKDSINLANANAIDKKGVKKKKKNDQPIPGESFYTFLTKHDHSKIYKVAKNLARNIKNYLQRSEDEFINRQKYITRYKIEWHRKIMLSVACIVLFFIGAPLGAIIRKGGFGLPVVFSIFFFLVFHTSTQAGEKMAKEGVVPAYFGMWLGVMVLIPFSIFLTNKAINDSTILDKEFYNKFLSPVTRFLRIRKKDHESTPA
jgi:lipopolysaccharide export system permease protein